MKRHVDHVVVSSAEFSLGGTELDGWRWRTASGIVGGTEVQTERAVVGRLALHEWRAGAASNQSAVAHSSRVIAND